MTKFKSFENTWRESQKTDIQTLNLINNKELITLIINKVIFLTMQLIILELISLLGKIYSRKNANLYMTKTNKLI